MTQVPETYLDHAASAPLRPEARQAMLRALEAGPGNASSAHAAGRRLRRLLEEAREEVAGLVGARPAEVVFTSGTSESNRLGIRGLLEGGADRLVTTAGAHEGVRALAEALAAHGTSVANAPCDRSGHVTVADVAGHAGDGPTVVAVELVQSVTGAVQPVARIVRALPEARVHVDAAQAVGRVAVSAAALGAATLACSAHKIGGPQGIGALVVRDDAAFRPPDGTTSQERGRRAGTEAVALAAGFAAAARAVADDADGPARHDAVLAPLREMIADSDGAELVSAPPTAPGIALVRFVGCRGDALLAALDAEGFRVSTGSACASGARTPPHVLTSAGWSARDAAECVRVSAGWTTSVEEVQRLAEALRVLVPRVRSALGDGEKKLSRSSGTSRRSRP